MISKKVYIYGRHAVEEAILHAPQVVRKVEWSPQMQDKRLRELVRRSGVEIGMIDERKISSQVEGGGAHQGIIALVSLGSLLVPFEKFNDTFNATADTSLVFLSEIQDPHNVGAIIRSAAAFGCAAVLIPTHKQASISGAVVKASAGMAFRVPLVSVDNVQQALATLKKKGVRVYGLAGEAKNPIQNESFDAPALFVMGNEADGIAASARSLVDKFVSIPIDSRAESLNVAAAAAVTLYAWQRRRG